MILPAQRHFLVLAMLATLALSPGCDSGPPPLLLEQSRPSSELLQHEAVERVAAQFLAEAELELRDTDRFLLPPIAAEGSAWEAAAVTAALLHDTGGLMPHQPETELASIPAVQAWLRSHSRDSTAWIVEASGHRPVQLRLIAASANGVWRSAAVDLNLAAQQKWTWPLSREDSPLLGSLELEAAEGLDSIDGRIWLSSRHGRRPIELHDGGIGVGELRPWEQWDLTWVHRHEIAPRRAAPHLARLWRDLRLELRHRFEPAHGGTSWSWWLARAGGEMRLPLELHSTDELLSIVAAPANWNLEDVWLVLLRDREGRFRIDVFTAALRELPAPRRPAAAAEAEALILSRPMLALESLASRRDPWLLAHTGVRLARWIDGVGAVPEPGFEWHSENAGAVWRFELPTPGEISLEHWHEAFESLRGAASHGVPAWLCAVLVESELSKRSGALFWRFPQAVPDLAARLCHPALFPRGIEIERAYATHRAPEIETGASLRLISRARGGSDLIVLSEDNSDEARARFLLGESTLIRPHLLGLDDPLLGADQRVDLTPSRRPRLGFGAPLHVGLVRHRPRMDEPEWRSWLRWLHSLSPFDLLGLDDAELLAKGPITGRPLNEILEHDATTSRQAIAGSSIQLELAPGSSAELRRAEDRIVALAAQIEGSTGLESESLQLLELALFAPEPLLRAAEIYEFLGGLEFEGAWALELGVSDPRRQRAAAEAEQKLLREGWWIPLWSQPGTIYIDRRVTEEESSSLSLMPLLHEARIRTESWGAGAGPGALP